MQLNQIPKGDYVIWSKIFRIFYNLERQMTSHMSIGILAFSFLFFFFLNYDTHHEKPYKYKGITQNYLAHFWSKIFRIFYNLERQMTSHMSIGILAFSFSFFFFKLRHTSRKTL